MKYDPFMEIALITVYCYEDWEGYSKFCTMIYELTKSMQLLWVLEKIVDFIKPKSENPPLLL
jgi:hypothetical protein